MRSLAAISDAILAARDGSADVSALLQAGLDALPTKSVPDADGSGSTYDVAEGYLPDGLYRCDSPIVVRDGKKLRLSRGAVLWRSTDTANTTAILKVIGIGSEFSGGVLWSENDHPDGILVLGHEDVNDTGYAVGWRASDFDVRGVKDTGNLAISIPSGQPNGAGSNYFGHVSRVNITGAGTAIRIDNMANAHSLNGIYIDRCKTSAVDLRGCYGNNLANIWVNTCDNGVQCLRLLDKTAGTQHTKHNTILNFHAEPGGADSEGVYQQSNDASGNYVQGYFSGFASAAKVWNGPTNNQQNTLAQGAQSMAMQGGASAPAYSFLQEPTSGVFRPSPGVVAVGILGTEQARFVAGGIVLPTLPTSDPVAAGRLWNDNGTVKISAG